MSGRRPADPVRVRRAAILAALAERFPGVPVWYGEATGRYWAMVAPGGEWRLVEAITPEELALAVARSGTWPCP